MDNTTPQTPQDEPIRLRKANEYINDLKDTQPPELLFDEFWREGELALLFGASGSGKSILAVQIADAIARGRKIDGFRMPAKGRRVLYVDMDMSGAQFVERNTLRDDGQAKSHEFSGKFYRESPPDAEALIAWLRRAVEAHDIRVVVIDSLTAVKRTQDGVRETLQVMRELRSLRDELRISILVVNDCLDARRGKMLTEGDMGRSRVLCSVADSVFAISRHVTHLDLRLLVQTRSRNAPVVWTPDNAPLCNIVREATGLLAFRFDDLYASRLDDETLELICNLKMARDEGGETFRSAAELFEITRSRAERLYRKWSPAIQDRYCKWVDEVLKQDAQDQQDKETEQAEIPTMSGVASVSASSHPDHPAHPVNSQSLQPEAPDEFEEAGIERPVWLDIERENGEEGNEEMRIENGEFEVAGIDEAEPILNSNLSTPDSPLRRSVYDLKRSVDDYGKEIFIEKEFEWNGKPQIYYRFDRKGVLHKWVRDCVGGIGTVIGPGPYLE